ncbi:acyltransferase domain-containing protein [Microbispora sp. KK1-11]|uniref:acyltransferase domain-containing protein n=1 Tax=Microbispora sp. KK1-11 TaxID=2053005 RepID=UPI0011578861|nr:acyltransferase domain-containing protein [Microbispora sp. KK1-11]TQS28845.1 acyltransferase domain-containing protein [Microbispora sp. KK1-11]
MTASRPVFLIPGQGAYLPQALPTLRAGCPEVDAVVGEIDDAITALGGAPIAKHLLSENPPTLDALLEEDVDTLQFAIYASAVVVHRILRGRGVEPSAIVGHSFGEIPALVAAGAFTVRDGATIVWARNAALRSASDAGGMYALPLDAERAQAMVALVADPHLVVAVENAPRQTVVSGSWQALRQVEAVAATLGVRATRLPAPYPFHNPLLAEAAGRFAEQIASVPRGPLTAPVYSPILGRFYSDADDLNVLLSRHLTVPVRFCAAVRALHARGSDSFLECGARGTLAGLVRAALPGVTPTVCLDGRGDAVRGIESVVESYGRAEGKAARRQPAPEAAELSRDRVLAELREFYAAALEYPVEVLEEDAELEGDLGVDSLKQTELVARVGERYGLSEMPEGFRITDHGTLGRIADLVMSVSAGARVTEAPAVGGAQAPAADDNDPPAPEGAVLSRDRVLAELREFYAAALEYPVEVLEEDAELEGDLGVDSLKQTELVARVGERYGLSEMPEGFRITDHGTLGRIADLVMSVSAGARVTEAPAVGGAQAPAADDNDPPAPEGAVLSRDRVLAELREFYAAALEYPVEVLEEDAELEGDLGVDSLKQTELVARVGERYGLSEMPEGFRITDHGTLGRIADLVIRNASATAGSHL